MKTQNYRNHIRYYPPHHFIFLPLMGFLLVFGVYKTFAVPGQQLIWALFSVACFCILYLAIMLRQHYALGNQDRIVRLEFRLRYFELYGRSFAPLEKKLSFGQIAALRFASDEELDGLLQRAVNEKLSGDAIKRAITNWQPDNNRV